MRRYLILGLLALGLAMPAMPAMAQRSGGSGAAPTATIQVRSGTYAVQGRDAAGTAYEGAAQLAATGPTTWRVTWRVGGETATGVGIAVGDALIVGYVSGRETGVVIYGMEPNGNLTGVWTQGTDGGVGAETLMPR